MAPDEPGSAGYKDGAHSEISSVMCIAVLTACSLPGLLAAAVYFITAGSLSGRRRGTAVSPDKSGTFLTQPLR